MFIDLEKGLGKHQIQIEKIGSSEEIESASRNVRKFREDSLVVPLLKKKKGSFVFDAILIIGVVFAVVVFLTTWFEKFFYSPSATLIIGFVAVRIIVERKNRIIKKKEEDLSKMKEQFSSESLVFKEIVAYKNFNYSLEVLELFNFLQTAKEDFLIYLVNQSLADKMTIPSDMEFFEDYIFESKGKWFQVAIGHDVKDEISSYILYPYSNESGSLLVDNIKREIVLKEEN